METFRLWVFLLTVVGALVFLTGLSEKPTGSSVSDTALFGPDGSFVMPTRARKLKGYIRRDADEKYPGDLNMDDYRHQIDPAPASKASVRPGPIEHGSPLNPYIPKPPSTPGPPPEMDPPEIDPPGIDRSSLGPPPEIDPPDTDRSSLGPPPEIDSPDIDR